MENVRELRYDRRTADDPAVIKPNHRGEYQFFLNSLPYLYISALDNKLHLLQADVGYWNVDGTKVIKYLDKNEDGFLDTFESTVDNIVEDQLFHGGDFLVYADGSEIRVKDIGNKKEHIRLLPPTNHLSWVAISQLLAKYDQDVDTSDLHAIFDSHDGEPTVLAGAELTGFRVTKDGFVAWILVNDPIASSQFLPEAVEPGFYYLQVVEHNISIQPVTPAEVEVSITNINSIAPETYEYIPIVVHFTNHSLEDVDDMFVILQEQREGSRRMIAVDFDIISINAQDTTEWIVPWMPRISGDWILTVQAILTDLEDVELSDLQIPESTAFNVSVDNGEKLNVDLFSLNRTAGDTSYLIILLFISIAVFGIVLIFHILQIIIKAYEG